MNNKDMVTNLRESTNPMTVVINGGIMKTTMEGELLGWFTVYVNKESLINILSMVDVAN